jgi:1-acyl-sn-glycerol-3-phosphate acyltransferase
VSGFFIVPLYTLVQERSDALFRSRIIAANNIMNALFMVVASLTLFFLISLGLTIPQLFLCLGAMNGAVAIYIYTLLPEFLFRFNAWVIANLMYRLKVIGDDFIPKEGAALLVCNHVSFVDWLIVAAAIKRPVRFVMDHSFASNWLIRRLMKRAKVILIATAKENPAILEAAFDQIARELADGEMVCIFPEGKITKDGAMNIFKGGMEKIIERTPVPVIPMALVGLWGSIFSRKGGRALSRWPRRFWTRVKLVIGAPVAPAGASALEMQNQVCKLGNLIAPQTEVC